MTDDKKKVLMFFGTRPEALKLMPLVFALRAEQGIHLKVCNTGQHKELLDSVLKNFEVDPDYNLSSMSPGQNLNSLTAKLISSCDEVINDFKPDLVVVHGDTNTTFAASLAAFQRGVKIAHIEAGLRTNNLKSPWPEEANRKLTSVITDYHFAPTSKAKENLIGEGVGETSIFVTGNTIIDALFQQLERVKANSSIHHDVKKKLGFDPKETEFILITGHRRENFGSGFENICLAIKSLAQSYKEKYFVFPVHLNPNVRGPVEKILSGVTNIVLVEPVNYHQFLYMMDCCKLIMTDSGGVQEEAPSLNKPVLILRDTTERPEIVESGAGLLVGADAENIVNATSNLLDDREMFDAMSSITSPFGDGAASERITREIIRALRHEKVC